uniref:Coiled-coil domain containing 24 n=1 Tax=Lepisosteus oculatus TaxID=7918 RepID=W5M418_LEPOC|nr:PREDICTED: coiled-coil domain-containing protein 24 isoform X1 [Lepisosteus oculatus]
MCTFTIFSSALSNALLLNMTLTLILSHRSFSRLSSTPSYLDDIEAIKDKLNIIHIDEVVAHLQSVLKEECEALESHVQFLQECVEQDRSEATVREPSVAELKEERKVIERDLQLAVPTHCSLKSDKVPICGTMLKSCRDIKLLRGSSANILKPRLLTALAPVQNDPEDTTKTLCNPLLSVKNVTPQRTLHDTKLSTAATERSCHRSDVPLRKCNWNPDNPYANNNSRSPLELPEVSVPSLDSIHFVDTELSRLGCHIKPGFSQCNTVTRNSRGKTHFHLVPMQRSASSPGLESAGSARASGPESPTQMLSSKFRLVPNCGPPSKIAVRTLIPTPPSVEKPAGGVQSASRRIRLLQGDNLASST